MLEHNKEDWEVAHSIAILMDKKMHPNDQIEYLVNFGWDYEEIVHLALIAADKEEYVNAK